MRRLLIVIPFAMVVAACGRSADERQYAARDSLYDDICALTRIYVDSMRHATDSADAEALMQRYQSRLQSVNMRYPASADRMLTEDLNDTIWMLTQQLAEARKSVIIPRDSIPADSVASDSIVTKK